MTDCSTTPFIERFQRDAENLMHRLVVRQHIGWLKIYCASMNETNWRDTKDRLERQIDELRDELFGHGECGTQNEDRS